MKRPIPLTAVTDVMTLQRDQARSTLGLAQSEWQKAQAQMEVLKGYQSDNQRRWIERGHHGVTAPLIGHHMAMLDKIEHAMAYQQQVMARLEQQVAQCQEDLLKAETKLASFKQYQSRQQQQWQQHQDRQLQKQMDEMAANRHRLNTASAPL